MTNKTNMLAVAFALSFAFDQPAHAQEAEPEHAFDGIYDQAQEDALLGVDCDARIKPTVIGAARDASIKLCVANFRAAINANKWPPDDEAVQ
jgi:hypothetical protein